MGLNKSKGNMYEWITHTWNPLAGECPHRCTYCSTNKLMRYSGIKNKYTGNPRVQELELKTNLGSGNFIFVAAQNDLFAEEIPEGVINTILEYCRKFDNKYLFQTKNPRRLMEFAFNLFHLDFSICTTIETNNWYKPIMSGCPLPFKRANAMEQVEDIFVSADRYVTIEPIMNFEPEELVSLVKKCQPAQVNIGADSGNNNLPEPSKEKILALIKELETFTKVELKSNLDRLIK